jgi:hypothetical protein
MEFKKEKNENLIYYALLVIFQKYKIIVLSSCNTIVFLLVISWSLEKELKEDILGCC